MRVLQKTVDDMLYFVDVLPRLALTQNLDLNMKVRTWIADEGSFERGLSVLADLEA